MNEELIKKEIQIFDITAAALAEMKGEFMQLKVADVNDVIGFNAVHAARMIVKKTRIKVEKNGLDLRRKKKAEIEDYIKMVAETEKYIVGELAPIETYLQSEEDIVENEKSRIKAEAEAKEAARLQARVERLESMGMGLIAGSYRLPYDVQGVTIPLTLLKAISDEQFAQFVGEIQTKKDAEDARMKAEEEARLTEQARILKVQQEQESERQRLAKEKADQEAEAQRIKKEQEDAEKKLVIERLAIQAEQMKIEREKKAAEDEKKRQVEDLRRKDELEQAKKEAAEKAVRDAEAKRLKDEADRIEKERKAKEAAEKKAARAPDKIKLLVFAQALADFPILELNTPEGKDILIDAQIILSGLIKTLREKAEAL